MTNASTPIWHPVEGRDRWHDVEVLASSDDFADGRSIAIVETFGSGWYANAMPPLADGTSSMIPGIVRGGAYGDKRRSGEGMVRADLRRASRKAGRSKIGTDGATACHRT